MSYFRLLSSFFCTQVKNQRPVLPVCPGPVFGRLDPFAKRPTQPGLEVIIGEAVVSWTIMIASHWTFVIVSHLVGEFHLSTVQYSSTPGKAGIGIRRR